MVSKADYEKLLQLSEVKHNQKITKRAYDGSFSIYRIVGCHKVMGANNNVFMFIGSPKDRTDGWTKGQADEFDYIGEGVGDEEILNLILPEEILAERRSYRLKGGI